MDDLDPLSVFHIFRRKKKTYRRKMDAYTSNQQAAKEESSAVTTIHSKDRWDQYWLAHKTANKLLVIYFSASWCGPCRFIEPTFKALSMNFSEATFLKIDVDELSEVSKIWNVEAMPTFVIVKEGVEAARIVGAKKEELESKIETYYKSQTR